MTTPLDPCPFCGAQPKPEPVRNEFGLTFICDACGACTFATHVSACEWDYDNDCGDAAGCVHEREATACAADVWNTRPLRRALLALCAELDAEGQTHGANVARRIRIAMGFKL